MAKKSSTNAVKKIDEQIGGLKKITTKNDLEKTPVISRKKLTEEIKRRTKAASIVKKTATKKTTTTKTKSATTKKTTPSSSKVRDKIIVTPKKKTSVKKAKVEDKNIRDNIIVSKDEKKNLNGNKNIRDNIIEVPAKKKKIEDEDLHLDAPIDLDKIEELGQKEIVQQFEDDIENNKYIEKAKVLISKQKKADGKVKRKRKAKNKYVVDLESTREYKKLERDLRSLYDKTNDIIEDIDKSDSKNKIVTVVQNIVLTDTTPSEKTTFIDHIPQKNLDIMILILSIIFVLLLICVIGFIIFVSTF